MNRLPIRLSSPAMRYVAMALDVWIIWMCGLAAYFWQHGIVPQNEIPSRYRMVVLAASLMMLVCSPSLYRSWRVNELWAMLRSVTAAWLMIGMTILAWLFVTKDSGAFSRAWVISWGLTTLAALWLQRLMVFSGLRWLRSKGYNYKSVVIVGGGPSCKYVNDALDQSAWSGLRVVARLTVDQLTSFMAEPRSKSKRNKFDEVWLCLPLSDEAGIKQALNALRHSTANIRLVPDWFSLRLINQGISEVVGVPMLDLSQSPMTMEMRILKATQDYILGSFILLLISPVMIAIAIAIKMTSPGPVFYQQRRHGWNGEEIWVYKFRSMVVHQEHDAQVKQATRTDARITPLGAFLRRTSLDELPQFINVLQGRMSIVGPRPHAISHNEHYQELVPGYALRHKVKPGITGWAQVNGFRGETDTLEKMQKRVEYDLYYIEHLSLWLDLKIVFATVFKGFVNKNAY